MDGLVLAEDVFVAVQVWVELFCEYLAEQRDKAPEQFGLLFDLLSRRRFNEPSAFSQSLPNIQTDTVHFRSADTASG